MVAFQQNLSFQRKKEPFTKQKLKPVLFIAWTVFLLWIVYSMFSGSWQVILAAIRQADPLLLAVICLLGLAWYSVDAVGYWLLYRRQGMPLGYADCFRMAFMSIFCDVTTMGAATKPLQLWYSYQKGADVGRCTSILIIPYIFQKSMITLFALVLFAWQHEFVRTRFGDTVQYVYLGAAGSVLVSVGLAILCTVPSVYEVLMRLIDRLLRAPRWDELRKTAREQLGNISRAGREILTDKKLCVVLALNSAFKLLLLYSIPAVSLWAVEGGLYGASLTELFTMTAIMKLIMGVLPTSGGVGSLEVVFSLLFSKVFGEVTGGTLMVLFRVATYYLPFLVSIVLVGGVFAAYRKQGGRTS